MRIKLKFLLEKNEITVEYRKAFMHYLKNALGDITELEALDLFYKDGLKLREMTFAFKLASPTFQNDVIVLGSNLVEVNISTSELKKALVLNNAFSKLLNKRVKFENNDIKLISINILEGKKVVSDQIIIKMMSPLCIREHSRENGDYYYSVANELFEEKVNNIINEQLKTELGIKDVSFKIEKLNNRKTVVTHYNQKIESSLGDFKITGNKKILQHLYDNGIGSRKSSGFGMFDVVK